MLVESSQGYANLCRLLTAAHAGTRPKVGGEVLPPSLDPQLLEELHEEVKHDCAPAYPSMWAAYKEIVPAVLRQLRDQEYYIRRELLPGAAPYNEPVPLADGRALPLAGAVAA